jgi:hypothetical protein
MALIETQLKNQPTVSVDYDYSGAAIRFEEDEILTRTEQSSLSVKSFNPSTGTEESVFEVNEFGEVTLANPNGGDSAGDLLVRDSLTGELITLDDGGSPALGARYEGNGALTLGYRSVSNGIGESSVVIGATESNPSSAPGTNNVAIGPGNSVGFNSTFNTETNLSFAFGSNNTLENTGTVGIGIGNTIYPENGYAFGRNNTLESSFGSESFYAIGENNTIFQDASDNTFAIGNDISWGSGDTSFLPTVIIGSGNLDIASSTDLAFLVGSGTDSARRNALAVKRLGNADEETVTHLDNLYLNIDPTASWRGLRGGRNIVISSSVESGVNEGSAFVSNSIIVDSIIGEGELGGSFVLNSSIVSEGVTQGGDGSMFINAELTPQNSVSEIYENAFIHSTRIGQDGQGNNDNSRKFAVTETGAGPISVFAFNDDTILAYQAVGPNNEREGSLVLVGTGSVDSPIKDVQNSLSIRGATMRAPRSVGIGPNVEVNTSDRIVLGNDNGTVVKQVQGSTADLFSVNLYNTSVGDAVNQVFTVEDDGTIKIGKPDSGSNISEALVRNPNTGEIETFDLNALNGGGGNGGAILAGLGLTSTFNASTGNTTLDVDPVEADTESDMILQDSSTGELISLSSGADLTAKHEGNGSFTVGYRRGTDTGQYSSVFGGADPSLASDTENFANGEGNVIVGHYNEINSGSFDQARFSAALGYGNYIRGERSVAIGGAGSFSGTRQNIEANNSFAFGIGNTNSSDETLIIGFQNNVTNSPTETVVLGNNLNLNSGGFGSGKTLIGTYNEGVSDASFEVGVGENDSTRITGAFIEVKTGTPIFTTTSVHLPSSTDSTLNDTGFGSPTNSIIINSTGDGSPSQSFLLNSDVGDAGVADSFFYNSSLTNVSNLTFFDNAMFTSSVDGVDATIDFGTFLIKTDIDSSNIDEFRQQNNSTSNVTVFAYNEKQILAYAGGLQRDGSVIIAGKNGGFIGNASNATSISGGNVSDGANNSVAIGGIASVSTSNTVAIGDTGGTDFYGGNVTIVDDEIDIQTPGNGVVVTTPDGTTQYRIAVDNNGNVTSEEI